MNAKLKEQRGRVEALRKELTELLEQAGPDLDMTKVHTLEGDSAAKVALPWASTSGTAASTKNGRKIEMQGVTRLHQAMTPSRCR